MPVRALERSSGVGWRAARGPRARRRPERTPRPPAHARDRRGPGRDLVMGPQHLERAEALGGEGKSHLLTHYAAHGSSDRAVSDPFGGDLEVSRDVRRARSGDPPRVRSAGVARRPAGRSVGTVSAAAVGATHPPTRLALSATRSVTRSRALHGAALASAGRSIRYDAVDADARAARPHARRAVRRARGRQRHAAAQAGRRGALRATLGGRGAQPARANMFLLAPRERARRPQHRRRRLRRERPRATRRRGG